MENRHILELANEAIANGDYELFYRSVRTIRNGHL